MSQKSDATPELPCSIVTELRSGMKVCLRPIHPSDQGKIERGIMELSDRSRYLRFFSSFKIAPPSVVEKLSAVDGFDHIAWGVVNLDADDHPAIAAAHAIRNSDDPARGEFAIAVLDDYQSKGVSRVLIAALFSNCLEQGLRELDIAILRENRKAAGLIAALGAEMLRSQDAIAYYRLDLERALHALRAMEKPKGLHNIWAVFDS
ncbi:GNAT family N-acetyltransferase [Sphingorhabdus sp. Alg231-15]|uniref:GNAT family N-acetyltransferase n=1 Tax=Sphingorhabdus sp. Alg231-15 TaxID=1922222 RepID=UPI000D54F4BC